MDKLIDGFHKFREGYYKNNETMLKALAAKGQAPRAIVIACSDARMEPAIIFGTAPGDIFMVRNVANLVPPYSPDGDFHGTSAALEFAILVLNVKQIIVMGHALCGGIGAMVRGTQISGDDFVSAWMKIAAPARERALAISKGDLNAAQTLAEKEGIKTSIANLMTFPWIKSRVESGDVAVHGIYFDLAIATLYHLQDSGEFAAV
ncbi:MAG: carbonic anhydrase [Alphaproteobacteria bacterium]|nr:carbonic anhydrase [Alphaproteobacteria bacterium]PHX99405.1 MAG: carbonic anhydrase [Rhodospirillaceae bacterium]